MLLRYLKTYNKNGIWTVIDTDIGLVKESETLERQLIKHGEIMYVPVEYVYNMFGDFYFKVSSMFDNLNLPVNLIVTDAFHTHEDVMVDIKGLSQQTEISTSDGDTLFNDLLNYNLNDIQTSLLNAKKLTYEFELSRKSGNKGLPAGNQMISSNDRLHPIVKSKITAYLRSLAKDVSENNLPKKPFSINNPCNVKVYVEAPSNRRMDPANWYPTVKALLDGMTDAGVWTDDDYNVIEEVAFVYAGLSGTKNYKLKIEITRSIVNG